LSPITGQGRKCQASAFTFIEAYVSGKTIDVQYFRELQIQDFGVVQASARVLYNEQRDLVGVFDALWYIGDEARQREIEVSVGTRVFAAFLNQENEDTVSVSAARRNGSSTRSPARRCG
jgi:hypothetical protein